MTSEEIGRLFLEMEKEIKVAVRKWLKRKEFQADAIHDALIRVLTSPPATPKEARIAIIKAVERAACDHFHRRRQERGLFPFPKDWIKGGKHIVFPADGTEEDVGNLPDDRPNPEEELIHTERARALTALGPLAQRASQDQTWRGELYRFLYVEGKTAEAAAQVLGIPAATIRRRAARLREWLRETIEGKQALKGGKG